MLDERIRCLPVAENDRLVGILTESDFRYLVRPRSSAVAENRPTPSRDPR